MVTTASLILPVLLSAALVWVASALIWTVLPWHKKDFGPLSDEAGTLAKLAAQDLAAGQYMFPFADSPGAMKEERVRKAFEEGAAGFITVLPRGIPNMGRNMALSAILNVAVGALIACVACLTLAPGAEYMTVFRVTAVAAWLAYGTGTVYDAIWFGRPWSGVFKGFGDALIYALLTGGAFGWLWPEMA